MTTLTLQTGEDTLISSASPTTNFGSNTTIGSGEDNTSSSIVRSLLKFDLTSIPAKARIISASLTLTIVSDQSDNVRDHSLWRTLRNWVVNQATWNQYSSGNNWEFPGSTGTLDYDSSAVLASLSLSASESGAKTWTFTAFGVASLQGMFNGTYPNYGFLLSAVTQVNDQYTYHSFDSATSSARPLLSISYMITASGLAVSPFMRF